MPEKSILLVVEYGRFPIVTIIQFRNFIEYDKHNDRYLYAKLQKESAKTAIPVPIIIGVNIMAKIFAIKK